MEEGYQRSREMAQKALALDPDLVEALLALADVQLEYDWDMRGAEASYLHALSIRPSDAEGLRTYGYFLLSDGRPEEAVGYYRKALAVDPMQARAYTGLISSLLRAERFDEIPPVMDALAAQVDPPEMDATRRSVLRWQLILQGQYLEAAELIPEQPARISDLQDAAIIHHHLGDPGLAQGYVDQLVRIAEERQRFFTLLAGTLVEIGLSDTALSYLEKGLEAHEVLFGSIRTDPLLRPLYHDPRFLGLLERAGLEPPPDEPVVGG